MRSTLIASVFLFSLVVVGCVDPSSEVVQQSEGADLVGTTSLAVTEGSPEAIGLLALLNDPSTTLVVLDDEVPLNSRAAKNLIHHRDGFDRIAGTSDDNLFDSVAEVDAVSYVGKSAMRSLLNYALSKGWVPDGDDVLGAWDGVTFTVDEAALTLEFTNRASHDLLDHDMAMDRRAADSIINAQPIASIETLSGLYYVGKTALRALKEAALAEVPEVVAYSDQFNHDEAMDIPDGDNYGVTTAVNVLGGPAQAVGVYLVVDLRHDAPSEVQMELTDPNGNIWEFEATGETGRYPVGSILDPKGTWNLNVSDWDRGNSGELYGWALEVSTETTAIVMQERFTLDMAWALGHWYRSYGADIERMGGNTLEEARAAISAQDVEVLLDPQSDPEGYDPATTLVLVHPDVVFPGSDMLWFAAYDRESATLADIYNFE